GVRQCREQNQDDCRTQGQRGPSVRDRRQCRRPLLQGDRAMRRARKVQVVANAGETIAQVSTKSQEESMKCHNVMNAFALTFVVSVAAFASLPALAADYPAPKEGSWVARDFRFHTGEVMPELRIFYRTVGEPTGAPVLILPAAGGSGAGFLNPNFGGELFGPGQPLDAAKYFIILPDT